jgi:hypothetical protein
LLLHFFSITIHLLHESISLPVLPVLELNPIFQPVLLFAILEQTDVALQALLSAIFPYLLHEPLEPLRLLVPPSSPILMLSKLSPTPLLLLQYTFPARRNGNPIPDDICVILSVI